jgi:dehydrogenase/reductase SDR family protein 12
MAAFTRLQMARKLVEFYGRFTVSFTRIGYGLRLIPFRPVKGNFSGQTWLVTASTGGIGRGAVVAALTKGARVFAVGRNLTAFSVLAESTKHLPGQLVPVMCDLSSMAEVSAMTRTAPVAGQKFDVVVNNVGILNRSFHLNADGFEHAYAVNLLGHYILVQQLFEAGGLAGDATIIEVVSGGLYNAPFNLEGIAQEADGYNGFLAYAAQKRAQLALVDYWRSHLQVHTYAFHPGWADTDGVKRSLPKFRKILAPILRSEAEGADTIAWLAANKPAEVADKIWFDRKPRTAHVYPRTRQPTTTIAEVLALLERDRAKVKTEEVLS